MFRRVRLLQNLYSLSSYNLSYCNSLNWKTISSLHVQHRNSFSTDEKQVKILGDHQYYSPFLIVRILDFFRQTQDKYSKGKPFSHYFILVKLYNFPKRLARKVIKIIDEKEITDQDDTCFENELIEYKEERDQLIEQIIYKHLITLFKFDRQMADKLGLLFKYYNIQTDFMHSMKKSIENNIEKKFPFDLYRFLRYIFCFRKPENQSPLVVELQNDIIKYLKERGEKDKVFKLFTGKFEKSKMKGIQQTHYRRCMKSPSYIQMKKLQQQYQLIQPQKKVREDRQAVSNVTLLSKNKFYRLNRIDNQEVLSLIYEHQSMDTKQRMIKNGLMFSASDPVEAGWKRRSYSQHPVNKLFTHSLLIAYPQIIQNFKQIIDDISETEDNEKRIAQRYKLQILIDEVQNTHSYNYTYVPTNLKIIDLLDEAEQIINRRKTGSQMVPYQEKRQKNLSQYWYK